MGADFRDLVIVPAHTACVWEATARKVGNVFPGAPAHDVEYLDFILSAGAILNGLAMAQGSIGKAVLHAVKMTVLVTRTNTNL
jgi:triphosphoribosyl-dephospho-CoA synthase